ncbi:MAG: lysylphosphatidylglycerol synthase transmembrane domain-containing protein [Actinomycetaceae bacterium]|nr:lysylphosphatidylglycerol synthase transmembrane domain-containing protein [Actinomycetaceae bacterium]
MTAADTASTEPALTSRLGHPVLVADRVAQRIHRTQDLFDLFLSMTAVALVLLLGAYAQGTTTAVTEDVRTAFGGVLRQILLLPLTLFESLFVLAAPLAVIAMLATRRRLRQIIESIGAGVVTSLLMTALIAVAPYMPEGVTSSLTITTRVGTFIALDVLIGVLASFLTVAGEASQSRTIRYSWAFLIGLSFIYVLRGSLTLTSALVSVLIGRMIGSLARYLFGFDDNRGGAVDLVDGLLLIGIVPTKIVRVDLDTTIEPLETTCVVEGTGSASASWSKPYYPLVEDPEAAADLDTGDVEFSTLPTSSADSDRHYVCWDTAGNQYDLIVLDPDTELKSLAHDVWSNIRLKNLGRWIAPSLQATAERAALVKISAHEAGVMTPKTVGVTAAGDSVFTVQHPVQEALLLADVPRERLTDEVLDRFYKELKAAHRRGISHRALDESALALDSGDRAWILNWDEGQVATSNLNRRIDLAQLITVLALAVGQERALASALRVFDRRTLQLATPVMQKAVLPSKTRKQLRREDNILPQLRQSMVGEIPQQHVPELPVTRFSLKTLIVALIGVVALWAVLGTLNFESIMEAVRNANPWWILASFTLGLVTYFGAAMPLSYFVPERLSLRETTMVQVGASVVSLVAPAGLGPAALNLRYLNKRGVATPLAVATVALVQFTQFVTTVATLLLVVLITGRSTVLELPSTTVIYTLGAIALIIVIVLAIPKIRGEIWKRFEPTWNQIWQRLVWVAGQPGRLAMGILGNLIMTVSYVAAFGASLAAFGYTLDPTTLAITFLASTSLGSVVPSPGGIGPVEAALTAGLTVAGIPSGIAISTALVYRLVTFYARAPLGWIALRVMQKKDLV